MAPWRGKLHEVIYEADTPVGKAFDVTLLCAIVISVLAVILESVEDFRIPFGDLFNILEWTFTIVFSVEYILRLVCIKKPHTYVISFYGVIDLLAILPSYLSLLIEGGEFLLVIRGMRLLRVYRVLKLSRYLKESQFLLNALRASRRKITVFLFFVLIMVLISGSLMYLIEGAEAGFTSIPRGMYWAIVTLTTVGYGDLAPVTSLGQFLCSILMVMGYGVIAVPTGVVTQELFKQFHNENVSTQACPVCSSEGHDFNAKFCKYCGGDLFDV
jgi:voltage-gated potassium channel